MTNMLARTASATGLIAALGLSGGCAITIASHAVEGEFHQTLSTSDDTVDLEVRAGSGRISVTTGEPGTVSVTGFIRGRVGGWSGSSEADMEDRVREIEANPPIDQNGDMIDIGRLEGSVRRHISVSYEVVVPPDTNVRASIGSGSQSVEGVDGAVDASAGSGRTIVTDVGGDVTASAGSGRIELTAIGGDARVSAGSGSIRIDGLDAALRGRTGSGSIRVDGSPGGEWNLRTGSGRITIDFPDDAAFELDARAGSGGVRSDHPLTVTGTERRGRLEGTVRGGGPTVTLRTGSGGITID